MEVVEMTTADLRRLMGKPSAGGDRFAQYARELRARYRLAILRGLGIVR